MLREQLEEMLSAKGKAADALRKEADALREKTVGDSVYFRGLIEFSNVCEKDCFYCGIRKSNRNVERFRMSEEEIKECAEWAFAKGYGSIVLQSGEATNSGFVDFVAKVVHDIKKKTRKRDPRGKGLGITLCVGEQSKRTYEEFFEAGAHRYLLRIETSNPRLYAKLHPPDCSFSNRVRCLEDLKEIGFQVGTGSMVGLPDQTTADLVSDLLFYERIDADMIGSGPYVVHGETPLAPHTGDWNAARGKVFGLSLNFVAAARLLLKDVNIAATTAFQAMHPLGREKALQAGANVLMPIITPEKYRNKYFLYDGKPCVDEDAEQCRNCLARRIEKIGRRVGWREYGDSPHYFTRCQTCVQTS